MTTYITHVLRMKSDTLMLIILYIINYRIEKACTGATLISICTPKLTHDATSFNDGF